MTQPAHKPLERPSTVGIALDERSVQTTGEALPIFDPEVRQSNVAAPGKERSFDRLGGTGEPVEVGLQHVVGPCSPGNPLALIAAAPNLQPRPLGLGEVGLWRPLGHRDAGARKGAEGGRLARGERRQGLRVLRVDPGDHAMNTATDLSGAELETSPNDVPLDLMDIARSQLHRRYARYEERADGVDVRLERVAPGGIRHGTAMALAAEIYRHLQTKHALSEAHAAPFARAARVDRGRDA